jgi:methionyl-tRNA formyltransferase
MIDVLVLGTTQLRHQYFALQMIKHFNASIITKIHNGPVVKYTGEKSDIVQSHTNNFEIIEKQYFFDIVNKNKDLIKKHTIKTITNDINEEENVEMIKQLNPKLIVVHSIELLKDKIINYFPNKIINLHSGLSPYYRGGGTNVFPFYNNELEYVGMTVHYIDIGIDSGDIIHQGRPVFDENDTIHTIGCKNVILGTKLMIDVIKHQLREDKPLISYKQNKKDGKLYLWKDFTEDIVKRINKNMRKGMIKSYAKNPKRVPIVEWGVLN